MKKKKWRNRKGAGLLALALTLALALSGTGAFDSQAADAVEVDRDCTLTIDAGELFSMIEDDYDGNGVDPESAPKDQPENVQLVVNLYQIAKVDAGADYYDLNSAFSAAVLDDGTLLKDELEKVNSQTSAERWQEMADAAKGELEKSDFAGRPFVDPITITEETEEVSFATVKPGLYLVVPAQVETPYYNYYSTAFLVSLPGNNVKWTEDGVTVGKDEWLYDVTSELKVGHEAKTGEFAISKSLTNVSGMPDGDATVVFQVDITTLEEETERRFVALHFSGAAETKVENITGIPAGSEVVVTEVYAGAGFELADGFSEEWKIDELPASSPSVSGVPVAVFQNQPDGSTTGGSGVTNHFGKDPEGLYRWTQITGTEDSTRTE